MGSVMELGKVVIAIVSESFSDQKQHGSLPDAVKMQVPVRFPCVDSETIKAVKKKKESVDPVERLRDAGFRFALNYQLLEQLRKKDVWMAAPRYLVLSACHCGLQMLIDLKASPVKFEPTLDPARLLNALQFVSAKIGQEKWGPKRNVIVSLFYYLLEDLVKKMPNRVIGTCLPCIHSLLSEVSEIPAELFTILVVIAKKVMNNQNTLDDIGIAFVQLLSLLVPNGLVPGEVIRQVLQVFNGPLCDLSTETLALFLKSIPFIDPTEFAQYAERWPFVVANRVAREERIVDFKLSVWEEPQVEERQANMLKSCWTGRTFENVVDLSILPGYPCPIPRDRIIPVPIATALPILQEIFAKCPCLYEEFAGTSIELIKNMKTVDRSIEIISCLALFLVYPIRRSRIASIFTDWLFDPSKSVFSLVHGYDAVFTMRKSVMSVLLIQNIEEIVSVFSKYDSFLCLFSEFLYVLRSLILDKSVDIHAYILEKWDHLAFFLIKALIKLLYAYDLKHEPSWIEKVNYARIHILSTLQALLLDADIVGLTPFAQGLVPLLFSFVYERPLRGFILDVFYKSTVKAGVYSPILRSQVETVLDRAFASVENREVVFLVHDVIVWLKNLSDFVSISGIPYDRLMTWIANSTTNELMPPIFFHSVYIMTSSSEPQAVTVVEATAIEKAINNLYQTRSVDCILWSSLVSLISGKRQVQISESFIVCSYRLLPVMLQALTDTELMLPTLKLFTHLCKFSSRNSLLMHKAEIDITLVDYLRRKGRTMDVSKSVIDAVLSLLLEITNHCTSVLVVNKVVSLFCPIDSYYLPIYQDSLMEAFGEMIRSAVKRPAAPLPIQPDVEISIDGLTGQLFADGFSMSFWIMVCTGCAATSGYVVRFQDSIAQFAVVLGENGTMSVNAEAGGRQWLAELQIQICHEAWTLVTMTLVPNNDAQIMTLYYQFGSEDAQRLLFHGLSFSEDELSITLGGASSESYTGVPGSYLGPFCIYQMTETVDFIRRFGPRGVPAQSNPIVFVEPVYRDDAIFLNVVGQDGVTASTTEFQIQQQPSFTDILVDHCHVDIILPLFAQSELKFSNGGSIRCFMERTVDILEAILSSSQRAQHDFAVQSCGFVILSHLLRTSRASITYSLFQKLVSLFSSLEDSDAVSECLCHILLNLSIWIFLDGVSHLRYLNDVLCVLLPAHKDIVASYWNPSRVLSMMRIYYYDNIDNAESFVCKDRARDMNVSECRRVFFLILEAICRVKFTKRTVVLITGAILTCPENEVIPDHIDFIMQLSNDERIPENISFAPFYCLQQKLMCHDSIVIAKLLMLFADLHHQKQLSVVDLIEYTAIISRIFPVEQMSCRDVFHVVLDFCVSTAPEIFPLMVMIARYSGDEWISLLLQRLDNSASVFVGPYWHLWLVDCLYHCSAENRIAILTLCCHSHHSQWVGIYNMIVIIGKAISGDYELLAHAFLVCLAGFIIGHQAQISASEIQTFVRIAVCHLFYGYGARQPHISVEDSESPTRAKKPQFYRYGAYLMNAIQLVDPSMLKRHWRMRVGPGGHWLDSDIAHSVLHFYEIFKPHLKSFQNDILLILAFNQRFDASVCRRLSEFDVSQYPQVSVVAVYNAKAFRLHHPLLTNASPAMFLPAALAYLGILSENAANGDDLKLAEYLAGIKEYDEEMMRKCNLIQESSSSDGMIIRTFTYQMNEYLIHEAHTQSQASKWWKYHWRRATSEHATWHKSLPSEGEGSVRYMRDNTLCGSAMVPVRLKPRVCVASQTDGMNCSDLPHKTRRYSSPLEVSEIKEKDVVDTKKSFDSQLQGRARAKFEVWEVPCEIISLSGQQPAIMTVIPSSITIYVSNTRSMKVIATNSIKYILLRTHHHYKSAIEIFDIDGKTRFLNFPGLDALVVLKKISELTHCHVQKLGFQEYFGRTSWTEKWQKRKISNFEYLMMLNIHSGRSFRDIHQYPIMPWISTNYSISRMLPKDPSFMRNLTFTMDSDVSADKIHPTWMLCDEFVYQYLVRLSPFSGSYRTLHGGKIDAEHVLTSMETTFSKVFSRRLDVRELTPEFFSTPEFLVNFDNVMAGDQPLPDVQLPPWASSPIDFVYRQRKLLESEFVSSNLPGWIDLVWGVEQKNGHRGNLFNRVLYPDVWDVPENKSMVAQIEVMLDCNGQVPQRLFKSKHPNRSVIRKHRSHARESFIERYSFNLESNIALLSFADGSLHALQEDGKFEICSLVKKRRTMNLLSKIHNKKWNTSEFTATATYPGGIMCVWSSVRNRIKIYYQEAKKSIKNVSSVNVIACDTRFVVTADFDSFLSVYDHESCSFLFSIPTFCTSIKCMCVSDGFHTIACGTKDGKLVICSLTSKSVVRMVSLDGGRPESIIITPAWGFIIVYLKTIEDSRIENYVVIYTINGDLIRKVRTEEAVSCLSVWASPSGFDYVLMSDAKHRVFVFEAYYGDITPVSGFRTRPCGLWYWESEGKIVVIFETGEFCLISKNVYSD